jgi:octaprenyl-diphosphate synthase
MKNEEKILSQFQGHLERINGELDSVLNSRVGLIEDIGGHILLGKGKRLRPLFFLLSCGLCGYEGEDVYLLSTIFEYIHAASLLHDDVLDNGEVRRRKPSANYLWGNHAAVLEGDFLYSKAFSIAVKARNPHFMELLTDTTTRMAEGQILELIHTDDWNLQRAEYMDIITAKTAVLMSAACACGAIISGVRPENQDSLAKFGMNMGIAFQMMDDVLDYTSSEGVFGKPVGKDVREGKITLPLIYLLSDLGGPERKRLEDVFRGRRAENGDYGNLIELVRRNGALDRIRREAREYVDEAAQCLSRFPESSAKGNLLQLNSYIIERQY